ncbi:hypothetical protein RD792_010552 [Penstemon davidsonii]|uniref:Uncharacterized protein n=1 Tax=Penstemon davidsonii TaxID=160366 RepID=A0ABR0D3D3_9LAMI|nr:hypothetical protein RD792_010552 [Penstemon davidsonii]
MKMMNKDSIGMEKEEEDDHIIMKSNKGLDSDPPHLCLLEQPHKDKGGKRKGVVLERLDISSSRKADVEIVGLSIICPGRPEISLSQPFISSPKACLFTLKEGTKYRLKFSFIVSNKIVTVDRCTLKLGTFSPRENPYGYQLEEETLPSGILVRGLYTARAKVIDSDGKCYMDIQYHFDIQKRWPSTS